MRHGWTYPEGTQRVAGGWHPASPISHCAFADRPKEQHPVALLSKQQLPPVQGLEICAIVVFTDGLEIAFEICSGCGGSMCSCLLRCVETVWRFLFTRAAHLHFHLLLYRALLSRGLQSTTFQ